MLSYVKYRVTTANLTKYAVKMFPHANNSLIKNPTGARTATKNSKIA